ncbi:hypothetical protein L202_04202 [Cryptococcus amylolentus CBS 6039]|uniref:Wax synthase domain-containing protein n=2 Tax=Cryptococcus amylolentus TaxID=104669 RepID=A0A1E3HQJ6_9TREE|nr:hypothetical protein L202_04202 [Cryptococcus amylolentus CBS 6039]ODN78597.1 hypothetical protein L202_04202 [Cryptococcus amylolentus CBS 6039]ODO06854.1 hypothetical protein I350_04214 [Cryptococcus amylolentus CBS 6273]
MSISLTHIFSYLPPPRPVVPLDYNLGFFNILLTALVLAAPHTGGWKLFRIGVAAPFISALWVYLAFVPVTICNYDHWGIPVLLASFVARTFELLVFFPAETHTHRLVPRKPLPVDSTKLSPVAITSENTPLVPEQVPPPFTLAKLYWAASLWWSFRGLGWNYCCPLPASSRKAPFIKGSSRKEFFIAQAKFFALAWIWHDLMRTIMVFTEAADFFLPGATMSYDDLSFGQRALYSIIVVSRTWYGLNLAHVTSSCFIVALGGLLGWEGEIWSPWGWPPLFGNFAELWKYPGLSTMWSRTWQGYNRRWLYVFGWIGISENILHLTHTGISSHPQAPPDSSSSANTPSPSGRVSPSHPIPTTGQSVQLPVKKMTTRLMFQNLVKSTIVFALSGLQHDLGTYALLSKTRANQNITLQDALILTPFFVIQPLALAGEAAVKTVWRGWKFKAHPTWKKGSVGYTGQPGWLVLSERLLGFIWTWFWLGTSAKYFVKGTVTGGAYWSQEGEVYPSLIGGLWKGAWFH